MSAVLANRLSDALERALEFTLEEEGGWSNHPADKGGATKYGITIGVYRGVGRDHDGDGDIDAADLRLITRDEARAIYRKHYWPWDAIASRDGLAELLRRVDDRILVKVFDIGVNAGPTQAARLLQRAANRAGGPGGVAIVEDGVVGPATLRHCVAVRPDALLSALCQVQEEFYERLVRRDPTQAAFIDGWRKRARRRPL